MIPDFISTLKFPPLLTWGMWPCPVKGTALEGEREGGWEREGGKEGEMPGPWETGLLSRGSGRTQ